MSALTTSWKVASISLRLQASLLGVGFALMTCLDDWERILTEPARALVGLFIHGATAAIIPAVVLAEPKAARALKWIGLIGVVIVIAVWGLLLFKETGGVNRHLFREWSALMTFGYAWWFCSKDRYLYAHHEKLMRILPGNPQR